MGSDGGFTEPGQAEADLEATRRWVEFAAHFPGAVVSMGSATVMSEGARDDKFAVAAEIYNRAAEIGRMAGVTVAVHPSSHHNTLLFSRADYDRIFGLLEPQVGWVPDTGHILRGRQAIGDTLAAHRDRIRYVHLKDVDAAGDLGDAGRRGLRRSCGDLGRAAGAPLQRVDRRRGGVGGRGVRPRRGRAGQSRDPSPAWGGMRAAVRV